MSKRSQIDQIIYAAVEIMSEFLPLKSSRQVTVLVDSFMSNLMRVYHLSGQDATILGFIDNLFDPIISFIESLLKFQDSRLA